MTHRLIIVFMVLICITEARVDFTHSRVFDEFDFKGQPSVAIVDLCADSCRIYASITLDSKVFASNLLIQTAKGFVSVADVAGRVDSASGQKIYLEVNNTAALNIVNANSKQLSSPVVIYVVNQGAMYITSSEIYEAEGFNRHKSGRQIKALTLMSALPFTVTQRPDDQPTQGVSTMMTGFDANSFDNEQCPTLYYVMYDPFPGYTLEVNGPIISLFFHFPPSEMSASIGISYDLQLERSGWLGSPGYHGCTNKEPYRSSLYDFSKLFRAKLSSDEPESLYAIVSTNTDDNHPVIITHDGIDYGFSDITVGTSYTTNLTIFWKPDDTGDSHFLIRWNSTIVPDF